MSITRNSWSFVTYSSPKSFTQEEAIATAEKYGLQEEVRYLMDNGYSPNEALAEWDII